MEQRRGDIRREVLGSDIKVGISGYFYKYMGVVLMQAKVLELISAKHDSELKRSEEKAAKESERAKKREKIQQKKDKMRELSVQKAEA